MTQCLELVKRNMRVYLRDKGAVFFSLLSMIIVLGLMLLFLGDMSTNSLTGMLSELPRRNPMEDEANALLYVLAWTCAGIVCINAVTVTNAVYTAMIKDREEGRLASIYTAPVSRGVISASYVIAAWACSVVICLLTLVLAEAYYIVQGGQAFSVLAHVKMLGMILVNSFTYATLMYLLAVLVKTEAAWGGLGTVIGTLVGFLGGIYIPIGGLGDGVAAVMKCTPVIYGAKMFRSVMTEDIGAKIFDGVSDELVTEWSDAMGVTLEIFGKRVSDSACIGMLLVCGLVFLIIGILITGRKKSK